MTEPGFIRLTSAADTSFGAGRAGDQHAADDEIGASIT